MKTREDYQQIKKNHLFVTVLFSLIAGIFPAFIFAQQLTADIRLNQLGFYPNAPKIAVVVNDSSSNNFYITSTNLRDTFFTGRLTDEKRSAYSSLKTRIADFSSFSGKGSFFVCVPGMGHSYVFEIDDHVNSPAAISTLKGYFYQRASMPLEEKFAGKWHRSAGHPDTAVYVHPSAADRERPAGTIISTPGGWYDAGDYNKYIVNSGISMATLLSAYEDFPEYFKQLHTNIPESGDDVPDILNEAIYNLRWMLTMQDPSDGGVYNKCTNAAFDAFVMPGVTTAPRYVVQKGTAASLDFAAVTAQATRILDQYKKELPGLADSCLKASERAWEWSVKNPDSIYNQTLINQKYKPEITTGSYGDRRFTDEWFWAASELYITTKSKRFYDTVNNHVRDKVSLPSWSDVGMLGYYSLLRFGKELPAMDKSNMAWIRDIIINIADGYISKVANNAFATVMGQTVRDFNWGSNSVAANQGVLLINAYKISGDKKYVDYALSNLDYLLGRNATGYCFVTGAGSKSPMFPHHRESTADGITDPVPGLLVGGPNPGMQDGCKYEFKEPETAYEDIVCAYASNEIAINWNAPMVYLANAIEALQNKIGYAIKK
jgi:endoglucanase